MDRRGPKTCPVGCGAEGTEIRIRKKQEMKHLKILIIMAVSLLFAGMMVYAGAESSNVDSTKNVGTADRSIVSSIISAEDYAALGLNNIDANTEFEIVENAIIGEEIFGLDGKSLSEADIESLLVNVHGCHRADCNRRCPACTFARRTDARGHCKSGGRLRICRRRR